MNREHIIAQAKADVLREASAMFDGDTAPARMLAKMAGEYEAAADERHGDSMLAWICAA